LKKPTAQRKGFLYMPPKKYSPLDLIPLRGPKHEIFGSRIFMHSKPVWVGDLGTRPKKQSFDGLDFLLY
jgi:hypothetical protein